MGADLSSDLRRSERTASAGAENAPLRQLVRHLARQAVRELVGAVAVSSAVVTAAVETDATASPHHVADDPPHERSVQ
jgi:hypothetical protein